MARGGGGRRLGGRGSGQRTGIRALEKRLTGQKVSPPNNPSTFVQLPWNSWTFERTDTTDTAFETTLITASDIFTQIRANVGLAVNADLRIKVQDASVWCTVAEVLIQPDISVGFFEIASTIPAGGQYPRSVQRDLGTLNMPAKTGYHFPSADKREIMGSLQGAYQILTTNAVTVGSAVTYRIHVLWQSQPAAAGIFGRRIVSKQETPAVVDDKEAQVIEAIQTLDIQ